MIDPPRNSKFLSEIIRKAAQELLENSPKPWGTRAFCPELPKYQRRELLRLRKRRDLLEALAKGKLTIGAAHSRLRLNRSVDFCSSKVRKSMRLSRKSVGKAIYDPYEPHGHAALDTPTYRSWRAMLQRCFLRSHERYYRYGGRGITVCERWRKFANFLEDMGERPAGTTIHRINDAGNYEPGNCIWASPKEQVAHRRRVA